MSLSGSMEREMGFEPTTFCLGSRRSATELLPLFTDCNYTFKVGSRVDKSQV